MLGAIHASSVLASFFAEPETWWGYVKDLVHALGRLSSSIYWILSLGEMGFSLVPANLGGTSFSDGPLISSSCSLAVAFSLEGRSVSVFSPISVRVLIPSCASCFASSN
jgi:hypothetical protein